MSAIDAQPFPRIALIGAAVMVAGALVFVSAVRVGRMDEGAPGMHAGMADSVAPIAEERAIRFRPAADGGLEVRDMTDDTLIETLPPGDGGFIRGILRGLSRDRLLQNVGADAPYRIIAFTDGRLAFEDLATGRRIDLGAFGADNRASFANLLPSAPAQEANP